MSFLLSHATRNTFLSPSLTCLRPPFNVLERWFQLICSSLHHCQHSQQQNDAAPEPFLTLASATATVDQHNHHHNHQQCRFSGHIPEEIINEVANYNSCSSSGQQQLTNGSQTAAAVAVATPTTTTTSNSSLLSDIVA